MIDRFLREAFDYGCVLLILGLLVALYVLAAWVVP